MTKNVEVLNLMKLHKACRLTLLTPKGGGGKTLILHGECDVKDSDGKKVTLKRDLDIMPLVKDILANLHLDQYDPNYQGSPSWVKDDTVASGDLHITHTGGWLSETYTKAVRIAKNIGENRIVKDIYDDILPEVAPFIPGGSAALSIVHKAHSVFQMARSGAPEAIAKVHQLVEMAHGDPGGSASQVVTMMHYMKRMIDQKKAYEEDRVSGDELPDDPEEMIDGWRWVWQDRHPEKRTRARYSKERHHENADHDDDRVEGWLYNRPFRGGSAYTSSSRHLYNEGRHPMSYGPHRIGGEGEEELISGWLYNKPYRDNLTATMQANKDPFFIARYLYNTGMGR